MLPRFQNGGALVTVSLSVSQPLRQNFLHFFLVPLHNGYYSCRVRGKEKTVHVEKESKSIAVLKIWSCEFLRYLQSKSRKFMSQNYCIQIQFSFNKKLIALISMNISIFSKRKRKFFNNLIILYIWDTTGKNIIFFKLS